MTNFCFQAIITVPSFRSLKLTGRKREMLEELDENGILHKELLDDLWPNYKNKDFLLNLLANYYMVKLKNYIVIYLVIFLF